MKKIIVLFISCVIVLSVVSLVVTYTYTTYTNTEQDYIDGALRPEQERGILSWSNPRYHNVTINNWQEKR